MGGTLSNDEFRRAMKVSDVLRVLAEMRPDNAVVVTNQGSSRLWPAISRHSLDFHYNPSTMGGAIPLGLGLALSDSTRELLVLTGDGSLLMSLGSLVTVAGCNVPNMTICLLDNGMYEVTGGQRTPATSAVDFAALARAAGIPAIARYAAIGELRQGFASFLLTPGPRFAWLVVDAADPESLQVPSPHMPEQVTALRRSLGVG